MSTVAHIRIQQYITPYHTLIYKLDMTRQWTPVKEYSDLTSSLKNRVFYKRLNDNIL